MFQKEQEFVNAVEEIKKNILIINGLIMKIRIKNPIWGVPITFLDKYCPSQFEILGVTNNTKDNAFALKENTIGYSTWASINGKNVYARLLIRRKKAEPIVEAQ